MASIENDQCNSSPKKNELFGEVSRTFELNSPRNECPSAIDLMEEKVYILCDCGCWYSNFSGYAKNVFHNFLQVHDMTSSYSEISIDSQSSPHLLEDLLSFEGSSISSDIFGSKRKGQSVDESMQGCDSKRPDKLDLLRYNASSSSLAQTSGNLTFQKALGDLHLEGTVTTEGDMVLFVAEDLESKIKLSSPVTKIGDVPAFPGMRVSSPCLYRQALMPQLPAIDPNILNDLEADVRRVATSVDTLTENLAGILHSVSALTVECLETYRDAVCKTCDAVDSNIKSMYQLMAKCEELSKSMEPIYKLAEQIKGIKRLLDLFENAIYP